ncbi:MAG TPA: hypothetical protein VFD50_07670 [Thermoleophilia bacterium]|nr:hypothetical protein [Thermoleophilia bacterium]
MSQVGLVLTPYLANRAPLLLLALRPQPEFVVLLGGNVPALAVVAVVVPLRWLVHFVYVEFGRWTGSAVLSRTRVGRWLQPRLADPRVSRLLLLSCLVHLGTPVDVALGAGGVDRRHVTLMLAAGSLVTTILFVTVGVQLAPLTRPALNWVVENRPVATAVCAALALVGLVAGRRLLPAPPRERGQKSNRS